MTDRRNNEPVSPSPPIGEVSDITLQSLGKCGDFGALAHYADPDYYAQCYRTRMHDVAYYARLASSQPGPILEYGCGNGRITLALAQTGARVWGVQLVSTNA